MPLKIVRHIYTIETFSLSDLSSSGNVIERLDVKASNPFTSEESNQFSWAYHADHR